MDEKQLQFLYNEYAKNKGFKDYSEFKGLMSSEGSRKLFFDDSNKELGFKDYDEFNDLLGLKKKVGGEEFSPTKSPSREYLSEGQGLADKGFIKTEKLDPSQLVSQYRSPNISLTPKPKKNYYSDKLEKGLIFDKEGKLYEPSSEALTKAIAPAEEIDLKKPTQKDLVEKSREAAVVEEPEAPIEKQGWLLNMVSALDKGFAKNFISSPIKGLGTVLQGATKKVMGGTGEGFVSDNLIKFGDYLNNAIDELTPQDEEFKNTLWDQAAQALGQVGSLVFTGGITGAAGKGAALVSQAPKGAVATAAKALGSQLSSPTAVSAGLSMGQAEFDRAKEAGATDDQAFEAFYKNALTGSVLETIPVMQFFKRFNNSTGGGVANYIKTKGVAGLTGGIEEMTTEVMQQLYSNKTAKDIYNINQDILDGVGSSGGVGFGVGFLLNAMGANAKILRKQGREQEATVLENQVKQYEDNLENPKVTSGNKVSAKDIVTQGVEVGTQKAVRNLDRDLANNVITPEQYQEGMAFAEKAAQVANKIPETVTGESRVKSIELLVERNDINQANQNLLQQKQTTDVAYHAGIDEEIKANEERIKKIDSEVYNIAKKPSKEFGTKRYEIDGEEVSQEAFEALKGKPLGTKTIIKAEVEVLSPEADIEKRRKEELDEKVFGAGLGANRTLFNFKDNTVVSDSEIDLADKMIDNLISKSKNIESAIVKLEQLGYAFRGQTNDAFNKFVQDRIDGKTNKSFKEWREESGKKANEINAKYDAELVALKEVKPTEAKEEIKVKAPTKELAEGEEVTFNTPEGKKLTGEKVTIPGFEKIDMVVVKEGLNNRVYDLASGTELVEGEFSKENLIQSVIDQFKEKNITQPKIYNLIYKGSNVSAVESKNRVRQINPSSMFESYSEKRKAYDKAEYEKLPLKYTPKEIEELNKLKEKAIKNGLDKVASDIDKRIEERGTENKVNYYDVFDRTINREIEEKTKEEAKNNKVPYPKEFIKKFEKVTEETIKRTVNQGFKNDKFEKIPQDVKKILIDGYQKNIDFLNKYGYFPYFDKSDRFLTKMYHYVASLTARENREQKIAADKKELIEALDDLTKAHEKEFGKNAEAEVKTKEGEVKVYNAKDLKENPKALEEDADYNTINYPKSFDILYTTKETLNSKNLGNKKIGDVINIFNKDYVIADSPLEKNQKVKLIRVDKEGNILRRQDTKGKIEKINYKDIVNNPKIFQENRDEIVGNYYGSGTNKSSVPALNKIKREIKVGDKINWGGDYVVLEVKGDKNNPYVYLADIDKDGNLIRIEAEEIEIEEPEVAEITKEEETNKQLAETELLLSGEAEKRRKEGKFTKDGIEYNRNEKQKGEVGNNGEVRFTNDVSLPFKYKLVEAETIQPSHENGIRNPLHFIPEAQPKNRNDVGSLQAEESFANNPRFEELGENTNAYSGSPVVNERGEVIQGNNRSAGLRKGYQRGNAQYKNDLANNAEKFGFTKEQVDSMNNPVLVREIAVSDVGAIELGNYDVKDLETGGKRRLDPVSITRRMPFELKGRISDVLFKGDDTLNKSLRDNSKKILELLSPYLNQSQRNTLFKDGVLTEAGAKDLEAVVQHFLFDGGDVALPDLFESLSYTQKEGLRKSLPSIFSTTSEKSITPQIQEAIIAINSFNESGIGNFDNWLSQTDMFNEGKTPNDTFSPTAIAIAKILNIGTQKEIASEFAKYADAVKDKPATMFEEAQKGVSKKEAIQQIFKTEYNETAEQKAIGTRGGKEAIGKQEAIEKTKPKSKPKPKPTESQAVKDYKEAVTKASKKAKENAKKEFVDRNFDLIIEKLKIQIKCPT
jgi:hypothetical protein